MYKQNLTGRDVNNNNVVERPAKQVHIIIQKGSGYKTQTTVQGLSDECKLIKIVRAYKKEFSCNVIVTEHPEYGEVIQLQGDQSQRISRWLVRMGFAKSDQVKLHSPDERF
ncbi:eukaryotic translation initiation factor 1-like [Drosophila miranda]|uniref:eukaryotic translation initiation factor 1-like n=1 Tax=Drosophila miranda TaxID=7229 RepID=UPI00143F4C79|nr:eukaryotic translation initiation factor 1-like [Drosophila miranda]